MTLQPVLVSGLLGVVLALFVPGCKSSCAGDNGMMCDFFPTPVVVQQDSPRLHFTAMSVTDGNCEPPQCRDSTCTALSFIGAALPSLPSTESGAPLPDARCRFEVSTAEGESLDIVVRLARMDRGTVCCCTGPGQPCNATLRTFTGYSWAVSVNGVELGTDIVTLPARWDAGTVSLDAAMP